MPGEKLRQIRKLRRETDAKYRLLLRITSVHCVVKKKKRKYASMIILCRWEYKLEFFRIRNGGRCFFARSLSLSLSVPRVFCVKNMLRI